jgi:hypothetical protein
MNMAAADGEVNALLDEAVVPLSTKLGAAVLAIGAFLVAAYGFQNLVLVRWRGPLELVPYALMALGLAGGLIAAKVVKMRAWALPASLAISGVLSLASTVWLILSFVSGVYSMLGVAAAGAVIVATVLLALAAAPYRRVVATRTRLRAAGYDLDF